MKFARIALLGLVVSLSFFAQNSSSQAPAPAPATNPVPTTNPVSTVANPPAVSGPVAADVACPFMIKSPDVQNLWARTQIALSQLEAARSRCPALQNAISNIQDQVAKLQGMGVSEEAQAQLEFEMAMRRLKSNVPIDSPGSESYRNCQLATPDDESKAEECLSFQYSLRLREIRERRLTVQDAQAQQAQADAVNTTVRDLSTRAGELVLAAKSDPVCKNDSVVVSAVVGTVVNLSNTVALGYPGENLFGVGIAGSVSSLSSMVRDLFTDKTVSKLIAGMNDETTFAGYACLYNALQQKLLRCNEFSQSSTVSSNATKQHTSKLGLKNLFKKRAEDILERRLPDPRLSDVPAAQLKNKDSTVSVAEYLGILQTDLNEYATGASFNNRASSDFKTLKSSLDELLKSYAKIESGKIDASTNDGQPLYLAFDKAVKEFNAAFSVGNPIGDAFALLQRPDNEVLNVHGALGVHRAILDDLNRGSEIGNLEWQIESQKKAEQDLVGFFQKSQLNALQPEDIKPLGQMMTAMTVGFQSQFKSRLGDYAKIAENSCRDHEFGEMLPYLQLCSLTAGMYLFNGDKSEVSIDGKFSQNSIVPDASWVEGCRRFHCAGGLPDPEKMKISRIDTPSPEEIKMMHRYVCRLSLSYDSAARNLEKEFKDGKVCGQPNPFCGHDEAPKESKRPFFRWPNEPLHK